jgi:hypothetical protein
MGIELLFEFEKYLSIIVSAGTIGAFFFTLKYRKYYSCWARSSILLGAVISVYHLFNCFLCGPDAGILATVLAEKKTHMISAGIHIGYQLSVAMFVYTILRFKWSITRQYKAIMAVKCREYNGKHK